MAQLPEGGAMTALRASEAEVLPLLEGRTDRVGIAAVNGPRSVVVSGEADAVAEVAAHVEKTNRLKVSHAFHSPLMEPMLAAFGEAAKALDYQPPRIPIVSTLTGAAATDEELTSPDYWVEHVRRPVRFAAAVETLHERAYAPSWNWAPTRC
ncbi:acyltransferase domain-containing protein [Streptomyces sp. M19]